MTMLRAGGLLDVLTSLSDCRHETVERIMERRIRGGCICVGWISTTRFVLWVFMCPTNIILFHRYHAEGYHAPSILHRLPRRGLPRPILTTTGYHACVYIPVITPGLSRSRLPRPILTTTGYHACVYIPVITPELSRSNTHVHRVITPAIVVRIL